MAWRIEVYVKMDRDGRVTIPKPAREKFGLVEGARLKFVATSNGEETMTLTRA